MEFVKILGMFGGGVLGVLVVAFFAAVILDPGAQWLFGLAIFAVVGGGVAAKVLKARG